MTTGDQHYGRRVDPEPKPGDYGPGQGGAWWAVPPVKGANQVAVPANQVTEHEDGTISVASRDFGPWVGLIDHGMWIEG